jgi:hypothetical protein
LRAGSTIEQPGSNRLLEMTMAKLTCVLIVALSMAGAVSEAAAASRGAGAGWHRAHHGHWHHGWRSGIGFGFGIGFLPYGGWVGEPAWAPGYLVVPAAPLADRSERPAEAVAPSRPDPVFVARQGQDAARTESDRRDCNRRTMTQRAALTDAAVFHRMSLACMAQRGYDVR